MAARALLGVIKKRAVSCPAFRGHYTFRHVTIHTKKTKMRAILDSFLFSVCYAIHCGGGVVG